MNETIRKIINSQLRGEVIDLEVMLKQNELTWEEIAKYGLDFTRAGECNHPDFELKKIKIYKKKSQGSKYVLTGKTPRGHNLVRLGKVHTLLTQGCPYRIAEVAISIKYGMERKVWSLAEKIVKTTLLLNADHIVNVRTLSKEILPSEPKINSIIEIAQKAFKNIRNKNCSRFND